MMCISDRNTDILIGRDPLRGNQNFTKSIKIYVVILILNFLPYIYLCLAATDTSVKLLQRRCSGMKLYTDYTFITKESTGEIPREVCPGIGEISCEV